MVEIQHKIIRLIPPINNQAQRATDLICLNRQQFNCLPSSRISGQFKECTFRNVVFLFFMVILLPSTDEGSYETQGADKE